MADLPPLLAPLPLCSVILISWNRKRELEAALDSVFAQTLANQIEVIVIDNASADGTLERLREKYSERLSRAPASENHARSRISEGRLRLYQYPRNMGASHARNAGVRLALAPHVAFLDSDAVLLAPDALERCLNYLQAHPAIRAVSGPIWFDRAKTQPFCFGGYITPEGHFHGRRTHSEREDPMFLSTCFAVWDKRIVEELGGFDPWYFWGIEDMDISLRAYFRARRGEKNGAARFAIVEGAEVFHDMSPAGRHYHFHDFDPKFRAFERQRMYMVLSYGGPIEFLRVLLSAPFHLDRIEREAWERRLRWRERFRALLLYPLARLLLAPWDYARQRVNHLARAPMPAEA